MKTSTTKFATTRFCRHITGVLIWICLHCGPAGAQDDSMLYPTNAPVTKTITTTVKHAVNKTSMQQAIPPATPVASPQDQLKKFDPKLTACGPWCAALLLLVLATVVITIFIGLLKLCWKLNHPTKKPKDPSDPDNQGFITQHLLTRTANTITIPTQNAVLGGPEDPASPMAWDITPYTTNGVDGVAQSPYHDDSGFPYCVMFRLNVQSCTNLSYPNWTTNCEAYGYLSFTTTNALNWNGSSYQQSFVQNPPQSMKILWYTNGALAAVTYDSITNNQVQSKISLPDGVATPDPQRFFRVAYPQED